MKAISANLINRHPPTATLCASRQSRRRMVAAYSTMKPAGVIAGRDPFRADRRPRAMNTKLLPRSGRRRDIYKGASVRNLWPSKPVDEEWRRNTYFIHIHSGFVARPRHRRFARGEGA